MNENEECEHEWTQLLSHNKGSAVYKVIREEGWGLIGMRSWYPVFYCKYCLRKKVGREIDG